MSKVQAGFLVDDSPMGGTIKMPPLLKIIEVGARTFCVAGNKKQIVHWLASHHYRVKIGGQGFNADAEVLWKDRRLMIRLNDHAKSLTHVLNDTWFKMFGVAELGGEIAGSIAGAGLEQIGAAASPMGQIAAGKAEEKGEGLMEKLYDKVNKNTHRLSISVMPGRVPKGTKYRTAPEGITTGQIAMIVQSM